MMALGPLSMLALLPFLGGFGLPASLPPLPPDPVVQRAAPEECLFYLGWNGNAKPDPNSKNRTEQLLADQEVQRFVDEVGTQLGIALAQTAKGKPEAEVVSQTLPGLVKTLVTRPMSLYVAQVLPKGHSAIVRGGLVVNVGSEVQSTADALDKLEKLLAEELSRSNRGKIEEVTVSGVKLKRLTTMPDAPVVFWGFKDNLFVACLGADEAEALLGRLSTSGNRPSWLEQLHKTLAVHRPAVASYINIALALKTFVPLAPDAQKLPAILDALGVSDIKSVRTVSGLTATGAVGKAILVVEGERKGVLAMLPAKPLTLEDMKIVPRNATFALTARFDFADMYKKTLDLVGAIEPRDRAKMEDVVASFEAQFGVKLLGDVLEPLGDSWAVFSLPGNNVMTGAVLTDTLFDGAKFAQTHEKLLAKAKQILSQEKGAGATINESMAGDTKICTLQFKSPLPVAPSWALTNDRLVIGVNAQIVKDFLQRAPDAPSLADVKAVQTLIGRGGGPSVLSYQDTLAMIGQLYSAVTMFSPMATGALRAQGIDVTIPTLPTLERIKPFITPTISIVRSTPDGFLSERYHSLPMSIDATAAAPVAIALVLPAVQSARSAARRNVSSNNLKQIALAMHNHHDAYKRFPAAAITDKEGKPLLSWRVKLLPYLDRNDLYQQFHLDEPWDSENNRKLIALMPSIYGDPANPGLAAAGKTRYVVPTGDATMFHGSQGLNLRAITDGTSRTIMAVEVAPDRAVVWSKPDDLPFDPKKPRDGLSVQQGPMRGFQAALADGSVHWINESTDEETLRRLFNPADGQPIDASF